MLFRILTLFLVLFAGGRAFAHEARPLTIVVEQTGDTLFLLSWRTPASVDPGNAPSLTLSPPCVERTRSRGNDPYGGRALYQCPGGIQGTQISIAYPVYNPSLSSLVRVLWRSGAVSTQALGPETLQWRAPAPETFSGVAESYFQLGVKHILTGFDHMLFLAGLLILAGSFRRVLFTVTGFTIAHSFTLALVALDLVRVSVPAIEAAIALSIVFVAAEIARGDRSTLAWRRPILVASTFGLLHGAGFAAVLGEIGLPQMEKPAALFFFNVGVEAGQVMIIVAALLWFRLIIQARSLVNGGVRIPLPVSSPRLAGYALGIISAYWFIQRLGGLFV